MVCLVKLGLMRLILFAHSHSIDSCMSSAGNGILDVVNLMVCGFIVQTLVRMYIIACGVVPWVMSKFRCVNVPPSFILEGL